MKKIYAFLFLLFVCGCHSASVIRYKDTIYPPTNAIEVYSNAKILSEPFEEIGLVQGSATARYAQDLLEDMKNQAMKAGADALINADFYYDHSQLCSKAVMIRYKSIPSN
ncbi:MAG: hypothetical protein ACHQM6_06800 [Candidatus Kapaibacterium sp.]